MAKPCPVCQHPSRAAIDQALLNGKPLRQIATTFGFTYTVRTGPKAGTVEPNHKPLAAHRDTCMPDAYQAAMSEAKTGAGAMLVARLAYLDQAVDTVLDEALAGDVVTDGEGIPLLDDEGRQRVRRDRRTILNAVREGRANLETRARLSGAVEDPDDAGLERTRLGLQDPTVRRALADLDDALAEAERRA